MIAGRDPNGCERCDAPHPLDARGLCDHCAEVVDRHELQARAADARERQGQRDLELAREAEIVAGQEVRADGSGESEIDTREQIHTGVSITAKIKRGSGTRDQDEIKIKAKGRNAAHAAAEMDQVLEYADEWSDQLRAVQPAADGGDA
ncbi:DUF7389 domain-containing protein [Natronorubrum halophilum]|uniref:DUF7389 domain-containing protein n=1 Tax=Natronorubrum halophilum TaxID=1702106 RepID=UPI0010C1B71A|nr:hypothetical protein [Natronorubrum halophilum]